MKNFLLFSVMIICTFINVDIFGNTLDEKFSMLEKNFDGKIGVCAINTHNNQMITYRADQRFPIQSTFKLMAVAALLNQSTIDKNILQEKITYAKKDLVFWHPITGKYINIGMTLEALSAAAISYSDNTAVNLIMKKLGGPQFIINFAHSIGNQSYNVNHYEANLNSNPKSDEDSSTPRDMAISVQKLILGNILPSSQKAQLITWMKGSTTGYRRIRSGVPLGWSVADKTGSGNGYAIANDIGIIWSPVCKPIVLAIYTVRNKPGAENREDIVASTTKIILDEFAKNDSCFNTLL